MPTLLISKLMKYPLTWHIFSWYGEFVYFHFFLLSDLLIFLQPRLTFLWTTFVLVIREEWRQLFVITISCYQICIIQEKKVDYLFSLYKIRLCDYSTIILIWGFNTMIPNSNLSLLYYGVGFIYSNIIYICSSISFTFIYLSKTQ